MSLRGGIDLGGTKIQAVIVDEGYQVLGDARVPTPTEGGPQDVADAMGVSRITVYNYLNAIHR